MNAPTNQTQEIMGVHSGLAGSRAWRIVAICTSINILDGFDILAMAYVAPAVAREWQLTPAELGLLLSSGLAGMMLGSPVLGRLADRVGRRPVILGCLVVATAGMAFASIASSPMLLALVRIGTGMAIGGLLPSLNSIVAEHAVGPRRGLAVALMQGGFALGASVGGFAAAWLVASLGWRAVFAAGALATIPLVIWAWHALPETLPINGRGSAAEPQSAQATASSSESRPSRRNAAWWLLVGAFVCSMTSLYFLVSWTPKVLADAGLAEQAAASAGAMLTAGGILSAIAIGWISTRRSLVPVVALLCLLSALGTAAFGSFSVSVAGALMFAFALGLMTSATQIGLYAICPALFPAEDRAGATGLAIGIGRAGAVAGPAIAGWLLAAEVSRPQLFLLMAIPYCLAAGLIALLKPFARH